MNKPKSINALMKHLRNNGIEIKGSLQKRQLINQGYYHGYKSYRFFNNSSNKLPLKNYDEINKTIIYDIKLKTLFYPKIMFIETAIKNITLDILVNEFNSYNINDLYEKGITSYTNSPKDFTAKQRKVAHERFLALKSKIDSSIYNEYKKSNPIIIHFYNSSKYKDIPIWAIFEILTMGDFGYLVSSLKIDIREKISKKLNLNLSLDTNRENICRYIYLIKDLRNTIAHNGVIYDVRFKKFDLPNCFCLEIKQEFKLPYVNFKDIVDYIVLVVFLLKHLNVSNREIVKFIDEFKNITKEYIKSLDKNITNITINKNWLSRICVLKELTTSRKKEKKC